MAGRKKKDRVDDRQRERFVCEMDPLLRRALRMRAALDGVAVSDTLSGIVRAALAKEVAMIEESDSKKAAGGT